MPPPKTLSISAKPVCILFFEVNLTSEIDIGLTCSKEFELKLLLFPFTLGPCLNSLKVFQDRKSTRLNSSHTVISYAVFCLKKKKKMIIYQLYTLLFLYMI